MKISIAGKDASHLSAWLAQRGIDLDKFRPPSGITLSGDELDVPDEIANEVKAALAVSDWDSQAKKASLKQYTVERGRRLRVLGADAAKLATIKQDVLSKIASGQITDQAVIDARLSELSTD